MASLGKVVVLASGSGTTFAYLFDEGSDLIDFAALFYNREKASVREKAQQRGVPAIFMDAQGDWRQTLRELRPDLIILAGYMKALTDDFIEEFRGKIVNVHPALLPKFGGKGFYGRYVHDAVIASGEVESGASVHMVEEEIDAGEVLAQVRVPVLPGMGAAELEAAVQAAEKPLYLKTIRKVLEEKRESTDQCL